MTDNQEQEEHDNKEYEELYSVHMVAMNLVDDRLVKLMEEGDRLGIDPFIIYLGMAVNMDMYREVHPLSPAQLDKVERITLAAARLRGEERERQEVQRKVSASFAAIFKGAGFE